MGLSAIKVGYRDEKEEMSGKNIEVSVISGHGFETYSENKIDDLMRNLDNFKPTEGMIIE